MYSETLITSDHTHAVLHASGCGYACNSRSIICSSSAHARHPSLRCLFAPEDWDQLATMADASEVAIEREEGEREEETQGDREMGDLLAAELENGQFSPEMPPSDGIAS